VRNPRTRKYAKTLGLGVVRGVGRSRARRARRGRWYMGRRLGVPPNLSYNRPAIAGPARDTRDVTAMPAAYNVTRNMVAGRMRMMKCEKGNLVVDCEDDDTGGLHVYALTPTNGQLWPVLAQSAYTYTKYRFISLTAEYRPRIGTQANGTVYMGWQPQMTKNASDFPSVEVISAMPNSCTTSVRQGAKLSIPITEPKEKFMGAIEGQSYDPLNYYNGTFVLTAQGDNADAVGEIWMSYCVELIQPKVDVSNKTSAYNFLTHTATPGIFNCEEVDTTTCTVTSVRPLSMIYRVSFASGTPSLALTKNGETIADTEFWYNGFHAYALFRLGACPRPAEIELTVTGVTPIASRAVFLHTVTDVSF